MVGLAALLARTELMGQRWYWGKGCSCSSLQGQQAAKSDPALMCVPVPLGQPGTAVFPAVGRSPAQAVAIMLKSGASIYSCGVSCLHLTGTFKAPRSWRWAKTFQGVADSKWCRENLVRSGKVVLVVPFGGETHKVGPKTLQAASAPCIRTQAGTRPCTVPKALTRAQGWFLGCKRSSMQG